MAYPEKVTYPEKYNLRPIVEPDGQFSAENANHIKEKINKNALFHDVHDNLAALQAAFPNPPVGAFAYLLDGSHYRCVNIGWVTNESGGGSDYFYGYHFSLAALEQAHPVGVPGARAIIKVTGGNDKEALWDEDDQEWFEFAVESVVSKTYVDDQDAATLQAAKDHASSLLGGTSYPKLYSFYAAHQQNLDYIVTGHFSFPDEGSFGTPENPISQPVTHAPGDATYDRIDMVVANNQGNFEVIAGTPSANPEEPSYDLATQIRCTIRIIPANATAPTIDETIVFAEGTAGEYTTSISGNSIVDNSSATPISGTISIEGTNCQRNNGITFTPDAPIEVATMTFTGFRYAIKNKIALDKVTHRIIVYGNKSNGHPVLSYLEVPGNFGYDSQDLNTQNIELPFVVGSTMKTISRIRFVVHAEDADGWGFFLDDLKLIGDQNEETPVTNTYVTREEMEAALAEKADIRFSNLVSDLSEAEKIAIKQKLGVSEGGSIDPIPVTTSRLLTVADSGKKLCINDPGIVLTYPAAGLGSSFEFNAVTGASGTLQLADENNGDDIDGATFLPEDSMGHAFIWPAGLLTTKGDWE